MKYILTIGLLIVNFSLYAQEVERQVIGAAGSTLQAGGLTVDQTAGEAVIGEFTAGTIYVTQGFQQGVTKTETGLRRETLAWDYRIYPNPSSDWVKLSFDTDEVHAQTDTYVEVADATGRIVYTSSLEQQALRFNVSTWPAGVYQMALVYEGEHYGLSPLVVR